MKFKIDKKKLESLASMLSNYVEKKDATSPNSCIRLFMREVEGQAQLFLGANSGEMGIEQKVLGARIEKEGDFLLSYKHFIDAIKALPDGDLSIEEKDLELIIKQGRSRFRIKVKSDEEQVLPPSSEAAELIRVSNSNLAMGFKKVLANVDTSSPKYALQGVLLEIAGKDINFVGSNGPKLSFFNIKSEEELANCRIIIPKAAVVELSKLLNEPLELRFDSNYFYIQNENFSFYTRLVADSYPDYARAFPLKFRQTLNITWQEFKEEIDRVAKVDDCTGLEFSNKGIVVKSVSDSGLEYEGSIDMELGVDSEGLDIKVKTKFIQDFLNACEEESFLMEINTNESAFVLSSGSLKAVVLPIRN